MAALVSTCVLLAAVTLTAAADSPQNEGGATSPVALNIPAGKGMRYAGPIVYSNEKPPIIYFPPPPKDAKPGFGRPGKKSKSIKYVPMPHHDLPVLIYTSDKMPPIHVVHPPASESSPSPLSSPPFRPGPPPKDAFRPLQGSLSATYKGIIPEGTSPRIVTSSYEIPSTSYGTPMSPMDAFDLPSSGSFSSEVTSQQFQPKPLSSYSFGPPGPHHHISHGPPPRQGFRGYLPPPPPRKSPPHILYSGQTPIHVFDEPEMFIHAPREVPLKTYEELPPKASFGPAKPAFGYPSVNSFGPPISFAPNRPSFESFGSPAPYRTISSYAPPRDNLIPSASSQNPSIASPPNSVSIANAESTSHQSPASFSTPQFGGAPQKFVGGTRHVYFSPAQSQKVFSLGPLSIEYGPPTGEPFVSFSEPQGSLQSFYGAMNDGIHSAPTSQFQEDGWIPGPPPTDVSEQIKDSVEPHPPPTAHHGPHGPGPIHNSIFRPHSQPHGQGPPHPPPFGGSKLAGLLSSFKLKRSKPKYSLAPKSMHKPPIIIYYGKKPPVHVYEKPEHEQNAEQGTSFSASSPSIVTSSVESTISSSSGENTYNNGNSNGIIRATSIENVDLTYGGSQKSEVRVAAPSPSLSIPEAQQTSPIPQESINRPAIIPAKPVDIFQQSDLAPSVYMARNSLNTIFVSDLNGGSKSIKTYIMRDEEEAIKSALEQAQQAPQVTFQDEEGNRNGRSIISSIAQESRISGEPDLLSSSSAPVSENSQTHLESSSQQSEQESSGSNDDDVMEADTSNVVPQQVVLVVSPEQKEELIEQQKQQEELAVEETQDVQVQAAAPIQSPSSFQTSLSNAEKEAEEKSTSEAA